MLVCLRCRRVMLDAEARDRAGSGGGRQPRQGGQGGLPCGARVMVLRPAKPGASASSVGAHQASCLRRRRLGACYFFADGQTSPQTATHGAS